MSIAKVIEVIAEGDSLQGAIEACVTEAAKSVHAIKGVYIENIQAVVDGTKITSYRVNAKVTFVVDG